MTGETTSKPTLSFWIVAGAMLAWNLIGLMFYYQQSTLTVELMADAGLVRRRMFPYLAAVDAGEPFALLPQSRSLEGQLPAPLREQYRRAVHAARERGTFFIAEPYHCCIGVKPGAGA